MDLYNAWGKGLVDIDEQKEDSGSGQPLNKMEPVFFTGLIFLTLFWILLARFAGGDTSSSDLVSSMVLLRDSSSL